MKVFLVAPTGEEGPFTPAQINRMHAQGKIKPEQLCRVEGTEGTKPISEVFRHFAPNAAVATAAKKKVAAYNRAAGGATVYTGYTMLFIGLLSAFFFNPYGTGYALIIVGAGLIGKGNLQSSRGEKAETALNAQQKQASPEMNTAKSETTPAPTASHEDLY